MQDKKDEKQVASEQFSRQQQKAYEKIRDEVIVDVKSLALNNNRIESLVEQLYGINKKLVALEGKLMRLADSYGISRPEFLKSYFGQELNPTWAEGVACTSVFNSSRLRVRKPLRVLWAGFPALGVNRAMAGAKARNRCQ